jgi:hypothetical protein
MCVLCDAGADGDPLAAGAQPAADVAAHSKRKCSASENFRRYGGDVALGGLPFEEEEAARRSRLIEVKPDAVLRLYRLQDQLDVQRILIGQGVENLDWTYILLRLALLFHLKGVPEIVKKLEVLRADP